MKRGVVRHMRQSRARLLLTPLGGCGSGTPDPAAEAPPAAQVEHEQNADLVRVDHPEQTDSDRRSVPPLGNSSWKIAPWILLAVLAVCAPASEAQSAQDAGPEKHAREFAVWTGGGTSVAGGVSSTGEWNAGLRFGWVLTDPRGPSFLRGRFEYAVDATPVFLVFQPSGTAYGAGISPLVLKWNFEMRRHLIPYLEIGSGPLFTNREVPPGTSHVNFASGAAFGLSIPRSKNRWNVEFRWTHISNAGLQKLNPGINALGVRFGVGRFSKAR